MIVEVEFNRDFWEAMLKKLITFYKDYLVSELLTQKKIYTSKSHEFILCIYLLNFFVFVLNKKTLVFITCEC